MYQTDVQYVSGYLTNTSNGINHFLSVGANGTSAVDGLVALLNVKILTAPTTSGGTTKTPSSCVLFPDARMGRLLIPHSHCSQAQLYAQPSLFPVLVALASILLSAGLFFV